MPGTPGACQYREVLRGSERANGRPFARKAAAWRAAASGAIRSQAVCQRVLQQPARRGSLPLDGFRGLESRMNTGLHRLGHRCLPSLLPSKTERFGWRGRWTHV